MKRRSLLKSLGLASLAFLPFSKSKAKEIDYSNPGCVIAPDETAGPYYFDANLMRQDVTEGRPGWPVNLNLTIVDLNCNPIPNAIVDFWHTDKDGLYSGYAGQGDDGNTSTVGETFMRGIQITDANGQVTFLTIFPGWYPGRVAHYHFKVHVGNQTYVTSQLYFEDSLSTEIYGTPDYLNRGQNPTTLMNDPLIGSNPSHLNTLLLNVNPGGVTYFADGTIALGINTSSQSVPKKQFSFEPVYPNPFKKKTTIHFSMSKQGLCKIRVMDLMGRESALILNQDLGAGKHQVILDRHEHNLLSGTYFLQLEIDGQTDSQVVIVL